MLKGKVALITGASRGIGRQIAIRMASLGAAIAAVYASQDDAAAALAAEISEQGGRCLLLKGDVADFTQAGEMVTRALETYGRVDILVCNAGITRDGLILNMKETDFDRVLDVNLKGAFNFIRHLSPAMLRQRGGRILCVSSVSGLKGNAGQANYAASKAGLTGLVRSVARELGSRGITANVIAPGFITTDMTGTLPDKVRESILAAIPLKCFGEPEDVAALACFLASDAARYITGQVICTDGGLSMS